MARFATGRLIESLIVLLAMSLVVYLLIGLMPGDPIDLMISGNPRMTSEDAARLRALYGLDKPLMRALRQLARPRRCTAISAIRAPIRSRCSSVLVPRLGNTMLLMGISFVCHVAIAVPLGVFAARPPNSPHGQRDQPVVFRRHIGPVLLARAALHHPVLGRARWLPAGGMETVGGERRRRPAAASHHAGDGADRDQYRQLHPLHARQHDPDAAPGLHPHGARQGRAASVRLLVGHALQNALMPVDHHRRRSVRQAVLGRADHRDHVLLARHGQAHVRRHPRQRL